jgi:HEPN domain-containing protein
VLALSLRPHGLMLPVRWPPDAPPGACWLARYSALASFGAYRNNPAMLIQENYASAAGRHLNDARSLCNAGRWDNTGYLAGYAAECSVKAVIDRAGIRLRVHLNEIPQELMLLAADLSFAARRYPVDMDPDVHMVRSKWAPGLRYAETGTLAQQDAQVLVESADGVFGRTVIAMVLDGLFERVPR